MVELVQIVMVMAPKLVVLLLEAPKALLKGLR
jgi:hypothetical protein